MIRKLNRFRGIEAAKPLILLLLVVVLVSAARGEATGRLSRKDLRPAKDGTPEEQELTKEVAFAPGVKFLARVEVTAKGNGFLRLANLNLKVFDDHNDGVYYEDEMLNIDFVDIDGNGKRDIVISGIVCFTDEKGDRVVRREAVVFIYALQANKTFKEVYHNTDFRLD